MLYELLTGGGGSIQSVGRYHIFMMKNQKGAKTSRSLTCGVIVLWVILTFEILFEVGLLRTVSIKSFLKLHFNKSFPLKYLFFLLGGGAYYFLHIHEKKFRMFFIESKLNFK